METTLDEKRETRSSEQRTGAYYIRRGLSWSGIWSGVFLTMALQLAGGLLANWANSASRLLGGQIPLVGISIGTGCWYLIYTLAAMFTGGLLATQQSSDSGARMAHSCSVWAVTTVIGFFGLSLLAGRMATGIIAGSAVQSISGTMAPFIQISRAWMLGGLSAGLMGAVSSSITKGTV